MSLPRSRLALLVIVALAFLQTSRGEPPVPEGKTPEEKPAGRVDLFGDPLPAGAVARLGTIRWRARASSDVAFSHDGKMLAAGSLDTTVRIWDLADRREIRRFEGLKGAPLNIAFSADGKTIACYSAEDVLRLWDAATGKLLHRIDKATAANTWRLDALAFSPDGKSVILAAGRTVRIFDVASGDEIAPPPAPEKGMKIDALAEDGPAAISNAADGAFVVWDLATGKVLGRVTGHSGLGPLAISPDRRRFALARKGDAPIIQVWDLETGKKLGRCKGHQADICSLSFSPDAKSVASGAYDLTARLWDAETGEERWRFQGTGPSIGSAAVRFAPDGKTVAAAGWDQVVRLIDSESGKERGDPGEQRSWIRSAVFVADGKRVFTGGGDRALRLWDAATGKELRRLKGPVIDSYSPERREILYSKDNIYSLACSPDGKAVAVSTGTGVQLWDLDAEKPRPLEGAAGSPGAAFSPDGLLMTVGPAALHQWDVGAGKERRELPAKAIGGVGCLCFSPDGRIMAVGGYDGTIHLWNVAGGREMTQFKTGPYDQLHSLAFSPDGKTLASSGNDWTVRVWEVASGKERERLGGKRSMMDRVAFSPDGRFLAFGGTDQVVHIYDMVAGKEVHEFRGHEGWIETLSFSSDGKRLVTGSQDCTALIWDMSEVRAAERPKVTDLAPKELDGLWTRLADDDPAEAGRAMRSLLAAPRQAAAMFRGRLRPETSPEVDRIARLIRDLDNDDFDVRERASASLREKGEAAATALRKALDGGPSPDARERLERLLGALPKGVPSPERLRPARAVEVLERIGTPEVKEILEKLADGASGSDLTQEAKAALRRLAGNPAGPP